MIELNAEHAESEAMAGIIANHGSQTKSSSHANRPGFRERKEYLHVYLFQ